MILYNIRLYIVYVLLYYVIILLYYMFIFVFIYIYLSIYKGSGQWQFIHLSEPSKHKFREEITSQDNVISSLNLFQNGPLFQASNLESPRPVWDAFFKPQTWNLLPENEESAEAKIELRWSQNVAVLSRLVRLIMYLWRTTTEAGAFRHPPRLKSS